MRSILIAFCLIVSSTVAFCQQAAPSGSVFGLVSDQRARLVTNAPIEAINVLTGVKFHVESGPMGQYRLTELPPGDYELSISIAGSFVQKRITVTAVSPVRLDIIVPLG
jgi:hypothetical protein